MPNSPAFGQADLTNCERELIHLAGSVQPHGVLLMLDADQRIVQASANSADLLGHAADALLGRPLQALGGDVAARVSALASQSALDLDRPAPLRCRVERDGRAVAMEGGLSRVAGVGLMLELEPLATAVDTVDLPREALVTLISQAITRLSSAGTVNALSDATVRCVREMTGYDRVMVYRFDPEGHGKIIAEARHPRLESLLGHHYPATDIPQRARELYLRNRVRVLVDVHYTPSPLVPRRPPGADAELDMSQSDLRSMSPLHLQYLKNMGVTATLVVSLVREGRLWGLIACHHDAPRNLRQPVRAAVELVSEVFATRLAAIENYAQAQVAILVRRLEQRLIEATSIEGDWRQALMRHPRTLLQPLEATGAALFHDGGIQTSGEVPSTPQLRALREWIDQRMVEAGSDGLYASHAVARDVPAFAALTATASGVLAVRLSASRPDYLMWFRKEQLLTVTWAGDPHKPMVGNDPRELSPRRSFAAWSEIVRGTAAPWTAAEIALARAVGSALVDIILQVHAVRLLVAEHQLADVRRAVAGSHEPVVIADAGGRLLMANAPLLKLVQQAALPAAPSFVALEDLAKLFVEVDDLRARLADLRGLHQPWRGERSLARIDGAPLPVGVRAEAVTGADGRVLGFIVILLDASEKHRAAAARRQLEESLALASRAAAAMAPGPLAQPPDEVISGIVTNASLAAMDIADGAAGAAVAPQLQELDASTRRAALLYRRIRQADDAA
ncbi:MAG: GAF domain-containing protein [Burkholderiaceae bacterium]|jgi:light-regulated signal transduction histidine kinase (bacteriophytochrome)|nr:GAF domain-containing protein [Burkholderiaceae bacterium]